MAAPPYAVLSDLEMVVPAAAISGISTTIRQRLLDARNQFADDKMRARYRLPLGTPYPESLTLNVAILTVFDCMNVRGYNPVAGQDANFALRAEMALKWFDDVERQRAHPNVIEAGGGDAQYPAPKVISRPRQGW